ncbi:hypothetical protein RISK_000864 [Rhodopirellula islandica]|uniref:Uncharacterized protein n=1 Tax=Rhodopirellula islandica TaxID=595434 RepID=A0A0J1BKV6_RHOIS|nr:hypothetical protein RISK_000864 [Rhodopirellula islandica]
MVPAVVPFSKSTLTQPPVRRTTTVAGSPAPCGVKRIDQRVLIT